MNKHLFIRGPLYGEFSNIIIDMLSDKLAYAGGYIMKSDESEPDKICIFPAYCGAGFPAFEKYCCLSYGSTIQRDNDAFRIGAGKLLDESYNYPFCIISPFGGYEIIIPQYREALDKLLASELPVIGYLINTADALAYKTLFGLGEHYNDKINSFEEQLQTYPGTQIINSENVPAGEIKSSILAWAAEYARF